MHTCSYLALIVKDAALRAIQISHLSECRSVKSCKCLLM